MAIFRGICHFYAICICLWIIGTCSTYHDEFAIGDESAIFRCNSSTTVKCTVKPNSVIVIWKIDNSTSASAQCFAGRNCTVFNNFTGRYSFTYNSVSGISKLIINHVTFDDDGREYKCSDNSTAPLKARVRFVPDNSSTSLYNKTTDATTEINMTVLTACTTDNISVVWYSFDANGSDQQIYPPTFSNRSKCPASDCVAANYSSQILSMLRLEKINNTKTRSRRALTEGRTFGVNVSYNNVTFSLPIPGSYTIKESQINPFIAVAAGFPVWAIIVIVAVIFIGGVIVIFVVCYRKRTLKVDDGQDTPTCSTLVLESVTENSVKLSWTLSEVGKHSCTVWYKGLKEEKSINKTVKVKDKNIPVQATLQNLEPGCKYVCSVYTNNSKGSSTSSKSIEFITLGRPNKPSKFEIVKRYENSIDLHWTPGHYRKYGQTFVLKLRNMKTGGQNSVQIPENPSSSVPFEYHLEGLDPGTEYKLSLYATNKYGDSEEAGPQTAITKGLPDTPKKFQLVESKETTVTVGWTPGKYRVFLQEFVIRFRLKKETEKWSEVHVKDSRDPLQYTVKDLQEGKLYEFELLAQNSIGQAKSNETLLIETKGNPELPSEFREEKSERTSTSLTVSWVPGTYRRDTQKFVINFQRAGKNGVKNKWKHIEIADDGQPTMKYTIDRLVAGKRYIITINAINNTGSSKTSDSFIVKTNGFLPLPPTEFICRNVTETDVQLSWKPEFYKKKQSFLLEWEHKKSPFSNIIEVDSNSLSVDHTITDLLPGTVYTFYLWSFFGKLEDKIMSECGPVQIITTKGLPEVPQRFSHVDNLLTETTATFIWEPGNYRKYAQSFILSFYMISDEENTVKAVEETVKDNNESIITHTVTNLKEGKQYVFALKAKNDIGNSEVADTILIETKGLPDVPTNFCHLDKLLTETTATFTWEPGRYRNTDQAFVISYYMVNHEAEIIEDKVDDNYEPIITHTVFNLIEGKQYVFALKAENLIGFSKMSNELIIQTKGLPEEPKQFCHDDKLLTETTATFQWEPGHYRHYTQSFIISYFKQNDRATTVEKTVDDINEKTITYTVEKLEEGKEYVFSLRAENKIGCSKNTDELIVETKGKPEPPTNFRIIKKTPTSITTGWTPGNYRKDMQHFVIKYRRVTRSKKLKWKTKICKVLDSEKQEITYEIKKLKTETEYEFSVYAENSLGHTDDAPIKQAVTEDDTPDEDAEIN